MLFSITKIYLFKTCPSPTSIFETVHYHFWRNQDENFMMASQQYRAWSNGTNV